MVTGSLACTFSFLRLYHVSRTMVIISIRHEEFFANVRNHKKTSMVI